jgi:hypothetical protein
MAGPITVDTIQSDSSYTSSINIASPVNFTSAPTMAGQSFNMGSRNVIINGGMRIAQRNTGAVSIVTTDSPNTNYYTVDRFTQGCRNASISVVRDTDVPTGQGFTNSLKFTCTQASSNITHNWVESGYTVENQDLLATGWVPTDPTSFVTLSFWAESSIAGTYLVQARVGTNVFTHYYTLEANTWKKITVSIPGHASNSISNNTNGNFVIVFNLDTGTRYTVSSSSSSPTGSWFTVVDENNYYVDYPQRWASNLNATFNFTGVQLEYGRVATPFEFKSFTTELLQCQRYYATLYAYQGLTGSGAELSGTIYGSVQMRTAPTLTNTIQEGGPTSLSGYQHQTYNTSNMLARWWVGSGSKGSPGYIVFTGTASAEF